MCPILDWINPENISACEDDGLKMWMYTSLEPWKQYCNFRLDNLLHESRLLFWQIAQLRLTGFLYWNLNAWEGHADPSNNTASYQPIDTATITSPYIDPGSWTPWQTHANDV
eukprot:COSAG02_NODE_20466_length_830_cov_1.406293_2_plen_111_part_01